MEMDSKPSAMTSGRDEDWIGDVSSEKKREKRDRRDRSKSGARQG
jgi:hypothetical protein